MTAKETYGETYAGSVYKKQIPEIFFPLLQLWLVVAACPYTRTLGKRIADKCPAQVFQPSNHEESHFSQLFSLESIRVDPAA